MFSEVAANLFLLSAWQQPCQHTRWDEEGVSLLKLHSLASISSVSEEDVALLPRQDPVLIKGQVMRVGGHQPKHLRRSTINSSEKRWNNSPSIIHFSTLGTTKCNHSSSSYIFKRSRISMATKTLLLTSTESARITSRPPCKLVVMCYHSFCQLLFCCYLGKCENIRYETWLDLLWSL